jgi:hypothetical protein
MSEGARLNRLLASLQKCDAGRMRTTGNGSCCAVAPGRIAPITPSENSRIHTQQATVSGILMNGGGVSQERVQQVLNTVQNPGSEGVRIGQLQQATENLVPPNNFVAINIPPILTPPPAPPLGVCIPKYMRIGS